MSLTLKIKATSISRSLCTGSLKFTSAIWIRNLS